VSGRAGRSGSRHKPAALRIVGGTHDTSRHGDVDQAKREIAANRAERIPSAPDFLKGPAIALWRRLGPILHRRGLLTSRYRETFALLCRAYGEVVENQRVIDAQGRYVTTDKGNVIQHPAVGAANRASVEYRSYAIEFGLSPSAEGRLGTGDSLPADPVDEFERERAARKGAGDAPVAG